MLVCVTLLITSLVPIVVQEFGLPTNIKLLYRANVIVNVKVTQFLISTNYKQSENRLQNRRIVIKIKKMSTRVSNQSLKEHKYNLIRILIFILTIFQNIGIANTNDAIGDNGVIDVENKYPFVVVLQIHPINYHGFELKKKCAGSLIDDDWVVTSAHCLDDNIKTIRYGNMTNNTTKMETDILLKIQHPLYKNVATKHFYHSENDIALIKVDKIPIEFGKIDPIQFTNLTNNAVIYADFERPYLALVNEDIRSNIKVENSALKLHNGVITDCKKNRKHLWYDALCVKTNRTALQILRESSGGPLLLEGKIIGVNVGLLYKNVVRFVPISPYLEWIHGVITSIN